MPDRRHDWTDGWATALEDIFLWIAGSRTSDADKEPGEWDGGTHLYPRTYCMYDTTDTQ